MNSTLMEEGERVEVGHLVNGTVESLVGMWKCPTTFKIAEGWTISVNLNHAESKVDWNKGWVGDMVDGRRVAETSVKAIVRSEGGVVKVYVVKRYGRL